MKPICYLRLFFVESRGWVYIHSIFY